MRRLFLVNCVLFLCCGCNHAAHSSDRRYHLTGIVKSVDPTTHTANIDAAAIPNYMEAMTMDYPIKSTEELSKLHVGEQIDATLNVHSDATYDLTDVHPAQSPK